MSNPPLKCQKCNGTGTVYRDEDCYNRVTEWHYTVTHHEQCPDCKGTGDQKCTYCDAVAVDTYLFKPVCAECDNQGYQGLCAYCEEPARGKVGLVLVCGTCKAEFDDERDKANASEY
jgi:hypothetical protein